MDIYIVKIEDMNDFTVNELSSYFDEKIRDLLQRKKVKQDKIRCLIGKMITHIFLCKNLNIKDDELKISTNIYGKPYVLNSDNLYFNISHSGEYVVCGINNAPIGIDIEHIVYFDYTIISKNNFSYSEKLWMAKSDRENSLKNFYKIWTLKESYIKAIGKGLYMPLKNFTINIDENLGISVVDYENKKKYLLRTIDIDKYNQMSVCSGHGVNNANIINISQKKVIELYKKLLFDIQIGKSI